MKRLSLVSCGLLAIALPALADNAFLTQPVLAALTAIDTAPSVAAINSEFATPAIAQTSLASIAGDASVDLGVRIRAIRTLSAYCPTGCGAGTVHDTLLQLINATPAVTAGSDVLVLRAAVESLGAARAVLPGDVATILPLLAHPSRDIRATVARTLRTTCSRTVLTAIISAQNSETTAQVRTELSTTVAALDDCVPQ